MFEDNQEMRKMALAITHYAYRNTSLEDYHSECIKMGKPFYTKVYNIVYKKLKKVKLFNKYIKNCINGEIQTKEDFGNLLNIVPEDHRLKFMRYLREIIILIDFKYGSCWDSAQEIECKLNGKSPATYVLSGHFLECCKNGAILDDKTMCYINKDVHNRIYSLLINGHFN